MSVAGSLRSTNSKNLSPETSTEEPLKQAHKIVTREEWIEARKAHLAHEKEYTRARDRLSEDGPALPWVKIDKDYVLAAPGGQLRRADRFQGRNEDSVSH